MIISTGPYLYMIWRGNPAGAIRDGVAAFAKGGDLEGGGEEVVEEVGEEKGLEASWGLVEDMLEVFMALMRLGMRKLEVRSVADFRYVEFF